MTASLAATLAHIDRDLEKSLERLFALLRIPSVSTDPAFKSQCRTAADWLARELSSLGFDASVRPTAGHPMVVAHGRGRASGPHVLFYGHYDVQPPDPLELWLSPPFEPRVVARPDGVRHIVGRGSADDKGQLMTFVEACRAFAATGGLPLPITILLEGEEETGSPSLKPFLDAHRDELRADVALVCDTDMWDADTPAITTMLRGLVLEEVIIRGAARDLHSGLFGGAAVNPIHTLARILADLHDGEGRVAVPGFYDGVGELDAEIKAQWS
ncbi:MAG TPA: M20/M25/M40 family metallo-hydrolase, partial [Xanthobacteraceae bacterium]|nr:M20/M25/M40 family metallo-hydrolase [Xanthobacteraceae bacterium]